MLPSPREAGFLLPLLPPWRPLAGSVSELMEVWPSSLGYHGKPNADLTLASSGKANTDGKLESTSFSRGRAPAPPGLELTTLPSVGLPEKMTQFFLK